MSLRARELPALASIDAAQWDALHDGSNPFVTHAFLQGLEAHGCLRADWGWIPRHLGVWDGDELIAAAPGYLKHNSHGEFVFDHAWAQAYASHGLDYYPKWLFAVPYSPVTGPRLLARDATARQALLKAIGECADVAGWSSTHVNFHGQAEDAAFDQDWLPRIDVQYHWSNRDGWRDFDGFLAAMDHKHRKNIRQERAKVAQTGLVFRHLHGDEATPTELDAIHRFYLQTFRDYGNSPSLTREFIGHIARTMPRSLLIILAYYRNTPVAGALCLRGTDTLYGRYWGSDASLPGLHFETCYYQGIQYCLEHGLDRFEPGAQGEHKLARGFLPSLVRSRHRIADPRFRAALRAWCTEEARSVQQHAAALAGHSPFRQGG